MNALLEKLKKESRCEGCDMLSESKFFLEKEPTQTSIPMINVALSGSIHGGLTAGHTMLAGPSKHFKTSFGLAMVGAFMKKHTDAVLMFYDTEFGSPQSYFESFGIDTDRVLHVPIKNVEQLKFDLVNQLEKNIKRGEKVIIMIDSIGNIASNKEIDDALSENSKADMTRAKSLKSLWRMITPYLTMLDVPLISINHTYMEQCLAGDTLIKTSQGEKKIKDIETGDMVYAINGLKEVIHTYKPEDLSPAGKRFLKLTFDDGSTVDCTHDHKFLTADGEWTQAEDIKIGSAMK